MRLYDVDPVTLSADLDSVSRVLAAGASAIVVSHLFGYPADVPAVAALAAAHGAAVIEDARARMFESVDLMPFEFIKESSHGAHQRILDAVRDRDPDRAAAEMRQHLAITRQEFERIIDGE